MLTLETLSGLFLIQTTAPTGKGMSLLTLPPELILCIVGFLDYESELSALSRTTRHLYNLLNGVLYTHNLHFGDAACIELAAKHGNELAVRHAIQAGAKPTSATLALATISGNKQIVRVLLDAGVDVNSPVLNLDSYPSPGEIVHSMRSTAEKCSHESILPGHRYRKRMFMFYPVKTPINIPPLCAAAHHGHLAMVKMLVDAGARVNVLDMNGQTPLFEAAYHGHIDIVRFLLESRASPNFKNRKYSQPLWAAASQNHLEVVRCLLDHGARATVKMLRHAASHNHSAIVQLVLQRMTRRLEALSDAEQTRLAYIAAACGVNDILKRLIDIGWDANSMPCPTFPLVRERHPDATQATTLSWAAYNGHIDTVRLLLSHGADPDGNPGELLEPSSVHFPLSVTLLGEHASVDIIQALLDAGADPDDDYEGDLLALATQDLPIFKLLLALGVEVDQATVEAVLVKNDPAFLKAILDLPDIDLEHLVGLLPRSSSSNSTEALLQQLVRCSKPTLDILLQHGFNPTPKGVDDEIFESVLKDVVTHGNIPLLTLLIDRGFSINRAEWQAEILEMAANGEDHAAAAETVDLLLAQGIDIDAADEDGKTPLHLATVFQSNGYDSNAVSILTGRGADPLTYVSRRDPRDGIRCPMMYVVHDIHWPKYQYVAALLAAIDAKGDDVEFTVLEEHVMNGIERAHWADYLVCRRIEKLLRQYYWRRVDERRARGRPVICGSSVVEGKPRASKGLFVRREED